jgi:hypothetical protein
VASLLRAGGQEAAVLTLVRAQLANADAERFVRTVRAECLDWLLIVGRRLLEQALRTYRPTTTRCGRIARSSPPEALNRPARPANAKVERHFATERRAIRQGSMARMQICSK